mmetsp:Transcript_71774/g.181091  ORF Transcript_71774/g.181091 Transcript_71774/m.181091 type:complete len:211 (+) Transcript_71774:451-1083(+)
MCTASSGMCGPTSTRRRIRSSIGRMSTRGWRMRPFSGSVSTRGWRMRSPTAASARSSSGTSSQSAQMSLRSSRGSSSTRRTASAESSRRASRISSGTDPPAAPSRTSCGKRWASSRRWRRTRRTSSISCVVRYKPSASGTRKISRTWRLSTPRSTRRRRRRPRGSRLTSGRSCASLRTRCTRRKLKRARQNKKRSGAGKRHRRATRGSTT